MQQGSHRGIGISNEGGLKNKQKKAKIKKLRVEGELVREMDDDDDSLVPQDAAAGAGAPEEEEEEWEMLDRLREEETRLKQAPVMKQRETFVTRPAPAPVAKAPRAPAPPANSKQAKVSQIMADTSLSPAERQRQVDVSAL